MQVEVLFTVADWWLGQRGSPEEGDRVVRPPQERPSHRG